MAINKITEKPTVQHPDDDAYVLITQEVTVNGSTYEDVRRVPISEVGTGGGGGGGVAAAPYDATSTYQVGEYCLYQNDVYRCTTAITTAEAWNSAHWTQCAVLGLEVIRL